MWKTKGISMIILLLVVAAIIGVATVAGNSGGKIFSSIPLFNSDNIYLKPIFGSLQCVRSSSQTTPITITKTSGWFGATTAFDAQQTCSQNVDSAGCIITITPSVSGVSGGVGIKITDLNGNIVENVNGINYNPQVTRTLSRGSSIDISTTGVLINDAPFNVVMTFTPYVLTYTSPSGSGIWNSQSCTVTSLSNDMKLSDNQIVTGCSSNTVGQYCQGYKNVLDFNQINNYFDGSFSLGIADYSSQLNGQTVACSQGKIYSIGTFTLKDGTTYKVTDKIIGSYGIGQTYNCCSGQETGTQICNNWNWQNKQTSQIQCTADFQCQNGNLGNGWSVGSNAKEITRGACQNNVCNYRNEVKTVECTSNGQCGNGLVCDIPNTYKCVNSLGTIISPQPTSNQINNINWFVLIGILIVITIIILLILPNKKSRGR